MKLAQISTLAFTAALLALPAFAADAAKTDAGKPAVKVAAPSHKSTKKTISAKASCKGKKACKAK